MYTFKYKVDEKEFEVTLSKKMVKFIFYSDYELFEVVDTKMYNNAVIYGLKQRDILEEGRYHELLTTIEYIKLKEALHDRYRVVLEDLGLVLPHKEKSNSIFSRLKMIFE